MMVKLKFFTDEINGMEVGLKYAASVRRFKIADDGIPLHVSRAQNGLCVKGKIGEYSITYEEKHEFFRALALLVGMLERGEENFCIVEKSALDMCGVMLDCSRNAVLRPEKVIDIMTRTALMGMNTFMLYMEDTYEIEGYEYFGYMRGRYSREELRAFDDAAKELGIELIPCIQTLAHLSTTLRWDYAKEMKDDKDVLLIDEDKTYAFIESMFKSWREVCSSDKIHIGMDEAEGVGLGEYFNRHGYCDRFEIMTRHVHKVCELAEKYGYKPMMWSDMFFKIGSEKRDYYDLNTKLPADLSKQIPENVSLVYWDYYHENKDFYLTMLTNHEKMDREIIFAGGAWTWRGLGPLYQKTFDTTIPALSACREKSIKKLLATMWKDDGGEVSIYAMLLGIQLFAEFNYYHDVSMAHLKDRFQLCTGYDAEAFLALELDDIPAKKRDALAVSKQVFYQDVLCGLFDKNLECYDLHTFYNEKLAELEALSKQDDLQYLFDYYRVLVMLLGKKCHIGVKIRKAYKEGDKKILMECAEELATLCTEYDNFHKQLYDLWHRENKPFGFEQFEIRIGGMMMRIKTAERKLREFSAEKIMHIEELEEELLWYGGKDTEGLLLEEHFYEFMH